MKRQFRSLSTHPVVGGTVVELPDTILNPYRFIRQLGRNLAEPESPKPILRELVGTIRELLLTISRCQTRQLPYG